MGVQVSVSITFTATDREDAIATVGSWRLHDGSTVTLMVEDPAKAITQPVMETVGIQDADLDGHIDVTPGSGGIEVTEPVAPQPDPEPVEPPPVEPPPVPVAAFTYNVPSGGVGRNDVITFDASSTTGATDYAWDFGNGKTATGMTATNSWSSRGDFIVTLTATGPGGEDQATQTVNVG